MRTFPLLCVKFFFHCIMAEAQPLRVTDFLPSKFQGEIINSDLARAHFLAFTDYLHVQGIEEPENQAELQSLVDIFQRTLRGQARLWIEGKIFENLDNLRDSFLARSSPSTSRLARSTTFKELIYIPGDTAEVHFAKISKAALPLGYTDEQICDKFLSSLPAQCRSSVLMSTPDHAPTQELVAKAQCYFDLHGMRNVLSEPDATMVMEMSNVNKNLDAEIKRLCDKIDALETEFKQQNKTRNENSPRSQDVRKRSQFGNSSWDRPYDLNITCYACGNRGHVARNCHKGELTYKRREQSATPNLTCYTCGNVGHMARECRLNARGSNFSSYGRNFQSRGYPNHSRQNLPPQFGRRVDGPSNQDTSNLTNVQGQGLHNVTTIDPSVQNQDFQ